MLLLALLVATSLLAAPQRGPVLMAHYMPWFENPQESGQWGWHWTMNKVKAPNCASHYHPLIGLYDSGDSQATDCHALLMKFSGIGGALIDWYGDKKRYDYLDNDKHTEVMIRSLEKAGLKYALVYEDATVPHLIEAGVFKKEDAASEGVKLLERTQDRWFHRPGYLRLNGKPLFLVFGPNYYQAGDWTLMLQNLTPAPEFYTVHFRRDPAFGAFDWPLPQGGTTVAMNAVDGFYKRSNDVPSISVAFPRFHDYYADAGVGKSYGKIEDQDGKTYRQTLDRALHSNTPVAQIATWNDWGEGTVIEPSVEFGYRDLEVTQRATHAPYQPADLRLPVQLYMLQKKYRGDSARKAKLNQISSELFANHLAGARTMLAKFR